MIAPTGRDPKWYLCIVAQKGINRSAQGNALDNLQSGDAPPTTRNISQQTKIHYEEELFPYGRDVIVYGVELVQDVSKVANPSGDLLSFNE